MRAPITLTLVFASGCSLLVPNPSDYTADLVDSGQVADPDGGRDAGRDGGTDGGLTCEPGLTPCDGACVDTERSLEHCGGCGNACAATDLCRAGECFDPVIDVSVGTNHSCVVRASGSVWCWGKNENGQLGAGDFADAVAPRRVADIDDALGVSAAGRIFGGFPGVTCVHRRSGQAWCWGLNDTWQLGDGTMDVRNRPVRVQSLEGAVATDTGLSSSCAIRTAGPNLVCWGGTRTDGTPRLVPESPVGLGSTRITRLSVSYGHTCAVDEDAQLWCWGSNDYGQLGDGTTMARPVARVVPGLPDVVEVATGLLSTCARQRSGAVWCWGMAQMLGVGMTGMDAVPSPQPLDPLPNAEQLYAGDLTYCAVRVDGSVWCWGRDILETVRTATETTLAEPVELTELADPESVAVGSNHLCVMRAGELECLGSNAWGQLGDGTMMDRFSPAPVMLP